MNDHERYTRDLICAPHVQITHGQVIEVEGVRLVASYETQKQKQARDRRGQDTKEDG